MDAAKFLRTLFGDAAGPDALISVWSLPDKRAQFHASHDAAAADVTARDGLAATNVYFGCGLYRPGITGGRGKATDVVGIVGLWADVDYGPNHKGKKLPPDLETASRIITRLGVQPSIVVHSGHGLQPWWLFKELLPVAEGAIKLSERWGATIAAVAHAEGYTVDSVYDLARVLRPPGTMNRKAEPVKVTAVTSEPLRRYEPDYIESMCSTEVLCAMPSLSPVGTKVGTLDLRPGRQLTVTSQWIAGACKIDHRFRTTWTGDRTDLDGSASAFDMALAHLGVMGEWSDQLVADLILYRRRERGQNTAKACRLDYINLTLDAAKKGQQQRDAVQTLAKGLPAPEDSENMRDPKRMAILKALREGLQLPIARWTQFGIEPADYTLILDDNREILIGPTSNVSNQRLFGDRVYEVFHRRPPTLKGPDWTKVQNNLGLIVEVKENPEGTRTAEVCEWIRGYIEAGEGKHVQTNVNEALKKQSPLFRERRLHVIRDKLFLFVTRTLGRRTVTVRQVEQALAAAGFTSTSVRPIKGAPSELKRRRFWRDDAGHFATAGYGGSREAKPEGVASKSENPLYI